MAGRIMIAFGSILIAAAAALTTWDTILALWQLAPLNAITLICGVWCIRCGLLRLRDGTS